MKFVSYTKTIIKNPQKAFLQIIKDKKKNKYIIAFAVFIIIDNFLVALLSSKQVITHKTPVSFAFPKNFPTLGSYYIFLGVPMWLMFNLLLHGISRLFSKKGSYVQLLVTSSFIGFIIAIPIAIVRLIDYFLVFLATHIVVYVILLYSLYLNIVSLHVIYAVNKQKAFVILLIQIFSIILLVVLIGIIFLIIFVANYYKGLH